MVRRLVEKEHVGILEQEFCEFNAHAPSARKFAGLAIEVTAFKTKAEKCLFHVLLEVGHVDGIEFLAHRSHFFDEFHVRVALVIGALRQFFVERVNLRLHLVKVGKGLCCFFKNGASVFRHQVLGKIGNDGVLRRRNLSASSGANACKYFEQCALTSTVLSHKGNTVFFVNNKTDVAKQGAAAKFDGKSIY